MIMRAAWRNWAALLILKTMKYQVSLVRIGYGFNTIEIEAESEGEARDKALDQAGDHEYSEKTAEYDIDTIEEI